MGLEKTGITFELNVNIGSKANVERSQEKNLAAFFRPQEPGTKKHLHLKIRTYLRHGFLVNIEQNKNNRQEIMSWSLAVGMWRWMRH